MNIFTQRLRSLRTQISSVTFQLLKRPCRLPRACSDPPGVRNVAARWGVAGDTAIYEDLLAAFYQRRAICERTLDTMLDFVRDLHAAEEESGAAHVSRVGELMLLEQLALSGRIADVQSIMARLEKIEKSGGSLDGSFRWSMLAARIAGQPGLALSSWNQLDSHMGKLRPPRAIEAPSDDLRHYSLTYDERFLSPYQRSVRYGKRSDQDVKTPTSLRASNEVAMLQAGASTLVEAGRYAEADALIDRPPAWVPHHPMCRPYVAMALARAYAIRGEIGSALRASDRAQTELVRICRAQSRPDLGALVLSTRRLGLRMALAGLLDTFTHPVELTRVLAAVDVFRQRMELATTVREQRGSALADVRRLRRCFGQISILSPTFSSLAVRRSTTLRAKRGCAWTSLASSCALRSFAATQADESGATCIRCPEWAWSNALSIGMQKADSR